MAPPAKRRPGYDRKAQYGLFASYVIAVGGVIAALLLLVLSAADPAGFSVLRGAIAEITRPISSGLRSAVTTIGNLDEIVSAYVRAGSQNVGLRRQIDATRTKLIEAEAIKQENARLKDLLDLVERTDDIVTAGRLISSSSSNSRRLARMDVGSRRGVQPGMPVRAPEGLVGRVLWTSPNAADVLLIIDEQNVVPVRRTRDNIPAIAHGLGDGTLEIRALNADRNPFRPGDVFVTSGIGGIYRPNIPVAVAARTARDRTVAIPLANPGRVELVAVERTYQTIQNRSAAPNTPSADAEPAVSNEAEARP